MSVVWEASRLAAYTAKLFVLLTPPVTAWLLAICVIPLALLSNLAGISPLETAVAFINDVAFPLFRATIGIGLIALLLAEVAGFGYSCRLWLKCRAKELESRRLLQRTFSSIRSLWHTLQPPRSVPCVTLALHWSTHTRYRSLILTPSELSGAVPLLL